MDPLSDVDGEKVVWSVLGLGITALAAFVAYSFVGAIVVGLFLYYATRPANEWLEKRFDHSRVNAVLTLSIVGVPMLLVLAYAGFTLAGELDRLLGTLGVSGYESVLGPYADVASGMSLQNLAGVARDTLPRLLEAASSVVTWALRLFVVVTVAYYLLREDGEIADWFRRTFGDDYGAVEFMEGVDDDLTTIYTGNLITIAITGLIAAGVYYALDFVAPAGTGVAYPVLQGLLTGVATIIPAIGIKLVYFPYTAYLLWASVTGRGGPLWFPVLFFATVVVAVDWFPDFIVRSYVSKGDINMGLMMLTYVLGAVAFGWYGVFLGPIVLVAFIHFARAVLPNLLDDGSTELVTE